MYYSKNVGVVLEAKEATEPFSHILERAHGNIE